MTVKELKEKLKNYPDDMLVIVQKDAEGNGYSPLNGLNNTSVYIPEAPWFGEVYDTKWTADEACMEPDEWEKMKLEPRALILRPIN